MNVGQEFIQVLVAFGGGKGGEPGNVAVRFLLPALFWTVLAVVSTRQWRREQDGQHLAIAIAALVGMARELLMFTAEYGSLHEWLDFGAMYRTYPPLEHAGTMLSSVLIAFAFINYRFTWQRFSRGYLVAASSLVLLLYVVTANTWPAFLDAHPRIPFGLFWGDMAFRISASVLMGIALTAVVYGRRTSARTSLALVLGILFLFLDELLMIFNLLTEERHVGIFAPIRHNLHIWAVPLFLGVYWSDLKYALREALAQNRKALNKAREEEEKTRAILAGIGDGISIQDTNFKVLFQNEVHKGIIGEHIGKLCYQGYEKQDAVCDGCPLARSFKDGQVHRTERSVAFPHGTRYFDITTSPIRGADGTVIAGVEAVHEVTSQRQASEAIEAERERLAVTLRSIGDAVIVTDVHGVVTLINKVAEQLTGWAAQDAVGRQLAEVFRIINEKTRTAGVNPVEKVLTTGVICGLANHTALIRKDGSELVIEDSAAPIRDRQSRIIGIVLVFRDMTVKYRMEEEQLKIEKLQSVGLLAGGIAHDFNNMLTAILGNISIAKMHSDKNGRAYARLVEAEKASRRATELTHQLLTFSKGGAPIRKASSIVSIIRECAEFTLSGRNVAIQYEIGDDLLNVAIDPGQISQVFNNLIINAVHAMPNGGTIICAMSNVVLGMNEMPMLRAGTYVKIVLKDTGVGIPPEHISRVFEPYFTTKQTGSGLGLATAFSIIRRHDGHITVTSKPGQGAEFHICLPATQQRISGDKLPQESVARGRGRILVMDDEHVVRDVAGEMLKDLGYEVAFAVNGEEAISLYEQALKENQRFIAVIMDLTIPGGMGGQEAMGKLQVIDPAVTAFVSSGYSNDPIMAEYAQHGFAGVITKPYSIDVLGKALGEVVKSPAPGIGDGL